MDIIRLGIQVDSDGIDIASRRLNSFSGSADSAGRRADKLESSLADLAKTAAGAIAAIAGIGAAADAWVKFDTATRNTANLTGAALGDIKQMALDSGAAIGRFAGDAAQAFGVVGSKAPALLDMPSALKAVTDQALELADAAKATGDAMTDTDAAAAITAGLNQWSVAAQNATSEADRFGNVLAAGAQYGSASISSMVESMRASGTVAASAGVGIEEYAATLQIMASKQLEGAEAGTALRNVISFLLTKGDDFEKFGIAAGSVNPKIVGLQTALQNLAPIVNNDTALVKVFGQENLTAAQILIRNTGAIGDMTAKLTGTNTAYKQAQDGLATFSRQAEIFGANLRNIASTAIDVTVAPAALSALSTLNDYLKAVQSDSGTAEAALSALTLAAGMLAARGLGPLAAQFGVATARAVEHRAAVLLSGAANASVTAAMTAEAAAQARAHASVAAAALAEAVAHRDNLAQMAIYGPARAAAEVQVTQAAAAHTAAISSVSAAEARATAALASSTAGAQAATVAHNVLAGAAKLASGALALVGGPVGAAILAATAIYTFTLNSRDASAEAAALRANVDNLANSFRAMGREQLNAATFDITKDISALQQEQKIAQARLETINMQARSASSDAQINKVMEDTAKARAAVEVATGKLTEREQLLANVKKQIADIDSGAAARAAEAAKPVVAQGEAAGNASGKIQEMLNSLNAEYAMIGKSNVERQLYKLQVEGATAAQLADARARLEAVDAADKLEKASVKGAKAAATEYNHAADSVENLWAALAKESAAAGMNEAEKKVFELGQAMKEAGYSEDYIRSQQIVYRQQSDLNDEFERAIKEQEDLETSAKNAARAQVEKLGGLQDEIKYLGMASDAERERAKYLDQFTGAYREQAAALYDQKAAMTENQRLWEEVGNKAEDFFTDLLTNGKADISELGNYIKTTLIKGLMDAATGGKGIFGSLFSGLGGMMASGGAMAGVAGAAPAGGGLAGTITGLAGSISNLGSMFMGSSGIASAIGGLGSMLGSSTISAFGAGMGMTGGAASAAAGAYGAAGMSGVGGALSAGSMLSAAMPWLAGAGLVANLAGLKIGGMNNWGTQGLYAGGSLEDFDIGRIREKEGLFGKKKKKRETFDIGVYESQGGFEDTGAALSDVWATLESTQASITAMVSQIGGMFGKNISDQFEQAFSAELNIEGTGEEFGKKLEAWISDTTGQALTTALDMALGGDTSEFAAAIRSLTGAATGGAQEVLGLVNSMFSLRAQMGVLGFDTGLLGNSLLQASGGVAGLQGNLDYYYSTFLPEATRHEMELASAHQQLDTAFQAIGMAVPATREDFISLAQSLTVAGGAAQEQLAAVLNSARAADVVYKESEAQVKAAVETVSEASKGFSENINLGAGDYEYSSQIYVAASEDMSGAMQSAAEAQKDYGDLILRLTRERELMGLSGQEAELAQLRHGYEDRLAEAEGNAEALALVEEIYGAQRLEIAQRQARQFAAFQAGLGQTSALEKAQAAVLRSGVGSGDALSAVRGMSFERFTQFAQALGVTSEELQAAVGQTIGDLQKLEMQFTDFHAQLQSAAGNLTPLEQLQKRIIESGISAQEFADRVSAMSRPEVEAVAAQLGVTTEAVMQAAVDTTRELAGLGQATQETADAVGQAAEDLNAQRAALESDLGGMLRSLADNALSGLQESVNAEKAVLDSRLQAEVAAIDAAHETRMAAISNERAATEAGLARLSGISGALHDALDGMTVQSEAFAKASRESGQAQLQSMLATARAGGELDEGAVKNALSAVSGDSAQFFGSFEDYLRDTVRTASTIADLAGVTDAQMSVEEKMLAALDTQQAASQAQHDASVQLAQQQHDEQVARLDGILSDATAHINALFGVDAGVKSVDAATKYVGSVADLIGQAQAAGIVLQQEGNAALYAQIQLGIQQHAELLAAISSIPVNISVAVQQATATVPGFATGGDFGGGFRIVGENGPELESTGPSRIFSHGQTKNMLSMDQVVAELRALREEIRAGQFAIAKNTGKTAKQLERWEGDGMPETRVL